VPRKNPNLIIPLISRCRLVMPTRIGYSVVTQSILPVYVWLWTYLHVRYKTCYLQLLFGASYCDRYDALLDWELLQ
jgi:hypothetical protein